MGVALASSSASAALQIEEGFGNALQSPVSGGSTGGEAFTGLDGGTGFAPASAWTNSNASGQNPPSIVTGLTYTNGASLATAGPGAMRSPGYTYASRTTAATIPKTVPIYLSFLFQQDGSGADQLGGLTLKNPANGTSATFGRVTANSAGGTNPNGWGFQAGNDGTVFQFDTFAPYSGGANYRSWTGVAATEDSATHLLVYKIERTGVSMWVDPVIGGAVPAATAVLAPPEGTDYWRFQPWNGVDYTQVQFSNNSGLNTIDEVRVGTTWTDVTPIAVPAPEPPPQTHISLRAGFPPQVDVAWADPTMKWTLETSRDLRDWAHVDVASYTVPQPNTFQVTQDTRSADFYRLSKVGSPRLYVIGDSISTRDAWPAYLETYTGKHTFTQAIQGATSPTMLNRTRGVELTYPLTTPVTPGIIHMKWHRHLVTRSHDVNFKTDWAYFVKAVSEPTRIEVSQNGRLIGCAKRILKSFTTNYAANPKTITCPGHGLAEGDRVTFIGNDPAYPGDLAVSDSLTTWRFSSSNLPGAVVERRVYFAANVTADSFELNELAGDAATLNLGSNATGSPSIECGWAFDVDYTGGTWDVTWSARTKYDDQIWLLEVSANDIVSYSMKTVTIPNILLLLQQMTEVNPRYILVCPPFWSSPDCGPGTTKWNNYYVDYLPWVKANCPANYIDTMAVLEANRTAKEKSLLLSPTVPEKVWLVETGTPDNETSWQVFRVATAGAHETWIGPGFTPLQYRSRFIDDIHLNPAGQQVLATAVSALITAKGW
jgi:lysophospholipase L1-like esterase